MHYKYVQLLIIMQAMVQQVDPGVQCIRQKEILNVHTFDTAQDGNTTCLCLPKYSQPQQTTQLVICQISEFPIDKGKAYQMKIAIKFLIKPVFIFRNVICFIAMVVTVQSYSQHSSTQANICKISMPSNAPRQRLRAMFTF